MSASVTPQDVRPGDEPERVSILLVDDQPARLMSYEAILAPLGQNLVLALSGVEALKRLMKEDFAVILLDVSMPGMDGFETATLIHQHPRCERTPIIFVTAFHLTELDRLKGYQLGAVDYVYVPVVPEILRSKVAVLVELHRSRRELLRLNETLERANAELALANSTLQAEKTRELERLNDTLAEANADLASTNESLQAEMSTRERLEQALREADRRKDEFLAVLAHELRNPLAPIQNAVQLMSRRDVADPEIAWCRGVIERQTNHLTRLVDDLLDVARITQGKIKLQREPVDVAVVVSRAIETTRPAIDARRHHLTVELADAPLWVQGDVTRLAQVVANLLSNAAKYSEVGGTIRLSVERVRAGSEEAVEEVVIRVRDSGVGIPPEMLPKLFELFIQVERTLDRSEGGLGIGLALVRRLVELHGGSVSAHSEGWQRGSEFTVRLPLAEERARAASPAPNGRAPAAAAAGRRILVVDDNADSAQSLAMLLEMFGNTVALAHDGEEAVAAAERFRPDVILMDLGMPKLDGYAAARRIRGQAWSGGLTLIALTGWGQDDVRSLARDAEFDAHFVKPVDLQALTRFLALAPSAGTS